jgi:1,4-alpha-glucan branching enzyme
MNDPGEKMIKKEKLNGGKEIKVTFVQPYQPNQPAVSVRGDFNNWQSDVLKLAKRSNGTASASVTLQAGQKVRFRYYQADGKWFNDEAADAYEVGEHGAEDCIVAL